MKKVYLEMEDRFIIATSLMFRRRGSDLLNIINALKESGNEKEANMFANEAETWNKLADDIMKVYPKITN